MRAKYLVLTMVALLLAGGAALAATTTGQLSGTVVDNSNAPLPGATVTIESPALIGGPRVAVTDANGSFMFPALDPGMYNVKIELSGFATQERSEVQVRLSRTTELNVNMPLSKFGEEITVVAETPVVDPTQVSTSQTFTADYLKNAAVGSANRGYQNVLTQAAGVAGGSNPNVFGSTLGENAYFVDGLDTTDPVTATFGTNFNFDAIQEIAFQTGGYEAEYGRATGGVVNLITKSGGNDFSGTLDVRYRSTSFYENGDHFDRKANPVKFLDPSATLGGPIVRDQVWFFVSGEYIDSQRTPNNSPTTYKYKGENYIGKVTWQLDPSWRIVGKVSGDPADIDNANASYLITPDATRFQKQGGDIYQAELNGILNQSLLWNLAVGINRQELNSYPESGDFTTPGHTNAITGEGYINYTNAQYSNRDRDEYKTNLTYFLDNFAGSHEFKGGLEYNKLTFKSHNYTPADGFRYYDVTAGYWYGEGGNEHIPYLLYNDTDSGVAKYDGKLTTAYLQDAWRLIPNLTMKIGVRYDQVSFKNDVGSKIADMDKFQPRIGFAYDVTGDAKNVVKASWGRFMHPSALTLPSFARAELSTTYRYRSCSTLRGFTSPEQCQQYAASRGYTWIAGPDSWDPNGWYTVGAGDTFGSEPSRIDPNLKPTYADEFIVGFEREIFNRTSIEVSYVDKKTKDIFEDTCNGNVPTPSADAACDYYLMANLSALKRDYTGYILRFETRARDWFHVLASYTYSKSKGSVEYDQNAGSDFDIYPDHYINRYGYLSDDIRNRVKINGYFILPYDFTVGFDAYYDSAFPYSRTIAAPNAGYGTEYLEPRGNHRANSNYQLDLQVAKGFRLGPTNLQLIGAIYNVFGTEQVTGVCSSDTGCGSTPWGGANAWQTPRRYEAGFRIEF